ncbi:DNA-binding transcription factor [Martiniozyma asiatica (nom. inval.)]|nr:DNA-binding transcription factor [Martiniozyma asiatica]
MSAAVASESIDKKAKPGRKPVNTEPKNKRTAQNRAAQRAFRERKERKMKELEDKVQLLEDEKTQIVNESELLRLQVRNLMSELAQVKGEIETSSSSANSAIGTSSSVSSVSPNEKEWFQNTNVLNELNNATFKGDGQYDENVFCNELQSACGSKECPMPKSVASPLTFNSVSTTSPFDSLASETTTPGKQEQMNFLFDSENIFDNIQNTNNNFDIVNQLDIDFETDDVFDNLIKNETPKSSGLLFPELSSTSDSIPVKSKDDMANIINKNETEYANSIFASDLEEKVPDNTASLMKCSQIWERITTHPRFDDIDIDGLCEELKQKAKCSEKGVVVDGSDVGALLRDAVKEHQTIKIEQQRALSNMFLDGNISATAW